MPLSKIKNSTVLIRVDYNISDPQSRERIIATISTIKELLKLDNKVVLMSHKGRPNGEYVEQESLKNILTPLNEELKNAEIKEEAIFINQFESFEQAKTKIEESDKKVFLLENTRFQPNEKSNDIKKRKILAAQYATLGDFFVDEAFAVSHRKEATNYDIQEFLPTMLGISHREEMENLKKLRQNPDHPYIFIMGGAKLETKLKLVKKVLLVANKVFLAGMLAPTFIMAKKELGDKKFKDLKIYNSYIENDFIGEAKELLQKYPEKILLPIDFVYDEDTWGKYGADVGPETLEMLKGYLKDAKTIFWNGPLGRYEKKPFDEATKNLASYIANLENCFTVIGGGDVVNAVPKEEAQKFSFVSMGGGASLDLLGR